MVLQSKQYIVFKSDDPLKAVIAGTRLKAYLVALFAKADGVDAAVDQYELSPAEIHAALVFYYDNEALILERLEAVETWLKENTISAEEHLAQMRQRMKDKD